MATCRWIGTTGDFNTTTNWSSGTAPTTGDTIIFDGSSSQALTTNINQSGVVFAAIYIDQANSAQIGTLTSAGVATYFQHGATNVYIGQKSGGSTSPTGSNLILLDNGSATCTTNVYDSATTAAVNTNLPPIQLKGTALTIVSTGGYVGVAVRQGETATVTITVSQGAGVTVPAPKLFLGTGVTITAFTSDAGATTCRANNTCTAATVNGGTYEVLGTGAHTALTVNKGTCYYSGTGTITKLNLAGVFDRTRDGRTVTITNTDIYPGSSFLLDNGVSGSTVLSNSPALKGCGMGDITLSTPKGVWI